MALSIGVEYYSGLWKTCVLENEHDPAYSTFADAEQVLVYLQRLCVLSPESIIVVATPLLTPFISLSELLENSVFPDVQGVASSEISSFIAALCEQNLRSYHLPSVRNLPSIPRHRLLNRQQMGSAAILCSVATLFYRMRLRAAPWSEMNFLYLEVTDAAYSILVVQDGFIVDGIPEVGLASEDDQLHTTELVELAFWEGLTRDLAGLLAIHHQTDIIIRALPVSASAYSQLDAVIKHFDDAYQFFLFPADESEQDGFEVASGAALLAEGLFQQGLTAEVVQQLLLLLPHSEKLQHHSKG